MTFSKIPIIRFNNYIDVWKSSFLVDEVNIRRGLTYKPTDIRSSGVRVLRSSNIIDGTFELFDNDIFVKNEIVSIPKIRNGDILVTAANGSSRLVGKHALVTDISEYDSMVHGGFMLVFETNQSSFINSWMNSNEYMKALKLIQGGNGAIGNLSMSILKNMKITLPSNGEQSAVGYFFLILDDLLASYKKNFANYQSLKITMLSKMFPKAGQKVPNFRLGGFRSEWECRKLGTIVDIIGGGTPDTNVEEYWNGEINWFSPTEVGNSIYLDSSEKKISELGLQKSSAKILPANRTILFTSRAGIGSVGIITKDSTTNQGFQSLVIKQGIDIYFLYTYSSEIKRYSLKHSAGSTFLEISGRELGKMDIVIPSYEEQQAIGDYFAKLDQLITSYQEKITQLETLKKKLLQDMFI